MVDHGILGKRAVSIHHTIKSRSGHRHTALFIMNVMELIRDPVMTDIEWEEEDLIHHHHHHHERHAKEDITMIMAAAVVVVVLHLHLHHHHHHHHQVRICHQAIHRNPFLPVMCIHSKETGRIDTRTITRERDHHPLDVRNPEFGHQASFQAALLLLLPPPKTLLSQSPMGTRRLHHQGIIIQEEQQQQQQQQQERREQQQREQEDRMKDLLTRASMGLAHAMTDDMTHLHPGTIATRTMIRGLDDRDTMAHLMTRP
jgi:hypothetical protein